MNKFFRQIEDDIKVIQEQYSYLDYKLDDSAYAFNYWVLSRLYNCDEEIIPSYVTDINDKGIDCYVHYEDTKELYLIQNKFYSENTPVARTDVSDFLKAPLSVLLSGRYTRSQELQKIFDRAISDSEYKIFLHFYVTNNYESEDIYDLFDQFDVSDEGIEASIYAKYNTIDEIEKLYYGNRFTEKKTFKAILPTRYTGTSLDVRPEEYGMNWMVESRYVLVNVVDLYNIYYDAVQKNYELFEENIREYLGTKGINNGIIKTLKSTSDRENFFYYNNGITIICEKLQTLRGSEIRDNRNNYGFKLTNPQIVNGCQTVNSIAEVLSHYSEEKRKTEFERTFVMVKVFVFDEKTKQKHINLDANIVKYTNSQNGINAKAFASKTNYFLNLQTEFKRRGVLLLVKPSDKYKFNTEFSDKSKLSQLNQKSKDLFEFFDLELKNVNSYTIPLEKLLKVILAFVKGGAIAFQRGSSVLNKNSTIYYKDFSLNITEYLSVDNLIRLYMLFTKAEKEKKANDNRHPIPYYLLGFMGNILGVNFESYHAVNEKLDKFFTDKKLFNEIYSFYSNITSAYSDAYAEKYNADYNVMIKQDIDSNIFESCIKMAKKFSNLDSIKWFTGE